MQRRKSTLHASGNPVVRQSAFAWAGRYWPALVGLALVSFPTWRFIDTQSWSTEQGSHGPLVLASGIWLFVRMLPETRPVQHRPAAWKAFGAIFVTALALVLFRIAAVIELEVYALYALVVALLYAFIGAAALQRLWFPLLYLLFAVPLPDSLVAALTNPLKIWISQSAVSLLYFLGYPIASAGVTIQIGQYQLLVAAACASDRPARVSLPEPWTPLGGGRDSRSSVVALHLARLGRARAHGIALVREAPDGAAGVHRGYGRFGGRCELRDGVRRRRVRTALAAALRFGA